MRFLCDVHISIQLVKRLSEAGCDCGHVNRLPDRWHTKDKEVARIADLEDRILISKDSDFRDSHIVKGIPRKLIKVNLGNIPTQVLTQIILAHLPEIERLNEREKFLIEVDADRLSVFDIDG